MMVYVFEVYPANFSSKLFIILKLDSLEISFSFKKQPTIFNTYYCLFCLEQNCLRLSNLKTKKPMNAKFSVVIIQVKLVIYSVSQLRVRLSTEGAKNPSWSWLSPLRAWFSMTILFFKTALLYLKVISNIVSESIYWERRTKMSPN